MAELCCCVGGTVCRAGGRAGAGEEGPFFILDNDGSSAGLSCIVAGKAFWRTGRATCCATACCDAADPKEMGFGALKGGFKELLEITSILGMLDNAFCPVLKGVCWLADGEGENLVLEVLTGTFFGVGADNFDRSRDDQKSADAFDAAEGAEGAGTPDIDPPFLF
jgi:hypothetical protein